MDTVKLEELCCMVIVEVQVSIVIIAENRKIKKKV